MSQPEIDPIQQAQDYIRVQQIAKAQRVLVAYLKQNPSSEQAWYLLSTIVDEPRKQIECLQRVLRINPGNTDAQSRLMKLMGAPVVNEPPPPQPAEEEEPASLTSPPPPVELRSLAVEKTPVADAAPIAPLPSPAVPDPVKPAITPISDTELSSLRSSLKFVKPRAPRKRGVRIVLLLLLILVVALVGGYFMLHSLTPTPPVPGATTSDTAALTAAPNAVPAPTGTPTITPIPSITPTRFPPTWTPTPLPTATPTHTSTPLATLESTVDAGLRTLQDQLSAMRGLPINASVPTALLARQALEPVLKSIMNIQGRTSQLGEQNRVLAMLGLTPPSFDLTQYTLNSFADKVGGFYLPGEKDLYVVGTKFGSVEREAYVHEFAHALVDQNYRVDQMGIYPSCQLDGQRCQAIQALLEGDATVATEQRFKKYATAAEKKDLAQYQPASQALPDDGAPLFITRDIAFAYDQGTEFVRDLYRRGGWAAVNQALANLPDSTEQLLHSEKYLAGEKPITVTAVPLSTTLGNPWQLIASDSLGEWRTYLLLAAGVDDAARLSEPTARAAAAGWGGDHYQVYLNPQTDQTLLAVQWAWDTLPDSAEFKQALAAYLDLRFRGAKVTQPGQDCWSANRQTTCLYSAPDGSILWLLGPDLATLEQARQNYSGF